MSLFLDIDAKGQAKNSYNSLAEPLAALDNFLKTIGLQPTMTVSSGGGVHTYIGFDRPISPDEWKPLALALAEAAKQHGLKCDTQCTVDVSRILRVRHLASAVLLGLLQQGLASPSAISNIGNGSTALT